MPESVASIRQTSSAKNNASGNVRSNNGGLYYTTSTTSQYTTQTDEQTTQATQTNWTDVGAVNYHGTADTLNLNGNTVTVWGMNASFHGGGGAEGGYEVSYLDAQAHLFQGYNKTNGNNTINNTVLAGTTETNSTGGNRNGTFSGMTKIRCGGTAKEGTAHVDVYAKWMTLVTNTFTNTYTTSNATSFA